MAGRADSPLPAMIHMTGAHGVARPTTNGPPAFAEATACRAGLWLQQSIVYALKRCLRKRGGEPNPRW
jgi:hypothetical protein